MSLYVVSRPRGRQADRRLGGLQGLACPPLQLGNCRVSGEVVGVSKQTSPTPQKILTEAQAAVSGSAGHTESEGVASPEEEALRQPVPFLKLDRSPDVALRADPGRGHHFDLPFFIQGAVVLRVR